MKTRATRQSCWVGFLMAASIVAVCASTSWAQIVSGSIVGTVRDATNAVLPGVTITVTHVATGVSRTLATDADGNYVAVQLSPGVYTVGAELSGFKSAVSSNITLEVDQRLRHNFTMSVGGVDEVVNVEATAVALESETPSLGQVVNEKQIVDLPLNGRDFLQLATLTPGSVPILNGRTSTAANVTGRTGLSVNIAGGRDDANSFLIDGVESRQPWLGTASILPSVDAIQEFKIQRSLFSAEYGQASGIINISIKSGSNAFHGTAFEFHRDDAFDARNFFDQAKLPFKMNQFGGTLGGPIRRGSTFFFVNYEGLRTQRTNTLIGNFPSARHLAGDFSDLPAGAIIDPLTRLPFPGNQVPLDRMSAVSKKYRTYYPAPNRNVPGANYLVEKSQVNDFDQVNARLDYKIGDRDSAFVRYSYNDGLLTIPSVSPFNGQRNPLAGKNLAAQETHIFGSRAVNVFKFGFNRGRAENLIENSDGDLGSELGFRNLDNRPEDYSLPTSRIIGFNTIGQNFLNQGSTATLLQFSDTFALTLGRHNLSTGVDVRLNHFEASATLFRQGLTVFAPAFTRNAEADFLLGLPAVVLYQHGQGGGDLRSQTYSVFVQDDWQASPGLTFNVGVRYDYDTPYVDADDRQGFFDPSVPGGQIRLVRDPKDFGFQATSPLLTHGGLRRGIIEPDKNNIAPRIGFAWSPRPHTAVRGGYGIFYSTQSANEFTAAGGVPPFVISPAIRPGTTLDQMFPDVNSPTFVLSGVAPNSIDPKRQSPFMQQWNLSVQQELLTDLLVEVSYSGSKGRNLWERLNINSANLPAPGDPSPATSLQSRRPFPQFGDVLAFLAREKSNYNALQVRVDKRFAHGYSFLLSYSFSKSLDTASGGFYTSSHMDRTNPDGEYGRSNFDVPHSFVFSHTWELPFGKAGTSALDKIIGGWQVNGILTLASGQPFSILVDGDNASVGGFTAQRANRVGDGNLPPDQRTPERWFDTSAFKTPAPGTFGDSGRNIIDGPGTKLYDFSLVKTTSVRKVNVQLRAEVFNLFNRANFLAPLGAGFDRVNAGPAFGRITQARAAREMQFGLKVIF